MIPESTQEHLNKAYILKQIKEKRYCEVSQTILVIEDTFLVTILATDEKLLVSGPGLTSLGMDPEDLEVLSAETGLPVE